MHFPWFVTFRCIDGHKKLIDKKKLPSGFNGDKVEIENDYLLSTFNGWVDGRGQCQSSVILDMV